MDLVDVIKHKETGVKYIIPNGDPLPSNAFIRLQTAISPAEAKKYITPSNLPKKKC